jgi:hypothetical protein
MYRLIVVAVVFLLPFTICRAQHVQHDVGAETKAEVPALTEFHTVIYQLWHTAWPEKDIALLTSLVPEIEKHADAIAKAELPGILRDKKSTWERQVKQLQMNVEEYASAARDKNEKRLLDAAEQLHAQYEKLVRVVRPPLAELDAFHTVLYPIYHYYLPEFNLDQLKKSMPALMAKMDALNAVVLPERKKKVEPAFVEKRTALSTSVTELHQALQTEGKEKITAAIEKMHADYQALEKILE